MTICRLLIMMNGYRLTLCCAAVAGLSAGCASSASRQGMAQLAMARQEYDKQNYVLAVHQLNTFIQSESNSRQVDQAYYLRGLCSHQMGYVKYDDARRDFERALKATNDPAIRGMANLALGHLEFESPNGDYSKAERYYQTALKDLPASPPKDAALYRLGVVLQRQGKWEQADLHLSKCFNQFPDSPFASQAKQSFGARTFRLQTGAFSQQDNARRKVAELQGRGLQADWSAQKKNDRLLYRVLVGKYPTFREAQQALPSVQASEPEAMIIAATLTDRQY